MTVPFGGSCLCGAVTIESTAEPVGSGHCQCVHCRKASGTGHSSAMAVPKAAVRVTGEVKIYESKAENGKTVGRAFCPTCGSPLYALNSGFPDLIMLKPSLLDDPSAFVPQVTTWAARAAPWDYMDPDLPKFDKNPSFMDE